MSTSVATQWEYLPPLPTLRGGAAVSAAAGRIHVIGGGLSPYRQLDVVESYDPAKGGWLKGAPMPSKRGNLVAATLGGKVYAIGGLFVPPERQGEEKPMTDPSVLVEVYDPQADRWTRAADLPFGRVKPAVAVAGGKLYLLGGREMDPKMNTRQIIAYDPASDAWTEVGEMPVGFRHSSGCAIDGQVYVTGGWTPEVVPGAAKPGRVYASLIRFDPATGACTQLAEMPVPRVGHACVASAGIVWVFGGITQDRSMVAAVHAYDPRTNCWSKVGELPSPRAICEGDVLDGTVYLPGGWSALSKTPNPDFLAFRVNP